MFDFAGSELLLIGIVALVAIGPKDLPVAIKAVSQMVKKARRMAGEFQTHVDEMVREADLGEARNAFNDLRRMDVKGQLLRAVDGDGTIRKGLTEPAFTPAPPPVPVHDIVSDIPVVGASDAPVVGTFDVPVAGAEATPTAALGTTPFSEVGVTPLAEASVAQSGEPAPAFVPPRYAPAAAFAAPPAPPAFIPPAFIPTAASRASARPAERA